MLSRLSLVNLTVSPLRWGMRWTHSKHDIDHAKQWLASLTSATIPMKHFDISFSRSSGPGGQKVNKTSSKATLQLDNTKWLNPQWCYWIPEPIRSQLSTTKLRYETKLGGILIQSDTSRNRDDNVTECLEKFVQEIKLVVYFAPEVDEDDKKRWDDIMQKSKEKRLFHKKKNSDKKKLRSKKFDI